jgi:thymidine phosphorylase
LEFDPALAGGAGKALARRTLENGEALKTMRAIMDAQGPPPHQVHPARHVADIRAAQSGVVQAIDCARIARIARLAGAPVSKNAGIDIVKKVGACVQAGEPIYRIHAAVETDFGFAQEMADAGNGYVIHS